MTRVCQGREAQSQWKPGGDKDLCLFVSWGISGQCQARAQWSVNIGWNKSCFHHFSVVQTLKVLSVSLKQFPAFIKQG